MTHKPDPPVFPAMQLLETGRLRMEPLQRSHAAELFAILSDPRLYEFIPQEPPVSLEALAARFEKLEVRRSPAGDEAWLNWVLRSKQDGVCIGRVEATVKPDRTAYIAYEIGTAHWKRGFAAEAVRRAIESLFTDYDVERITAEVDTRNAASIRLLERLGFLQQGIRRAADFFKGSSSDEITYALPRSPRA